MAVAAPDTALRHDAVRPNIARALRDTAITAAYLYHPRASAQIIGGVRNTSPAACAFSRVRNVSSASVSSPRVTPDEDGSYCLATWLK